jgi:uncharacterized membrane protein YuzA (DUF378 family)
MQVLKYLFSWPVFWVAAFAFNVVTGVFGINNMTLRRVAIFVIGGILAGAAAWQTAQQASDQDTKYKELSDSITGGDSYAEIIPEGHDEVSYAVLNLTTEQTC